MEICSSDGKILQVITTDGQQIRIFEAGDKLFKQYCEAVGAEPAKRVDLR